MSSPSAVSGRIAEIFFSIQGEGPTAGLPAVFIRLQGCSVGCRWCDTKYSWDPAAGRAVDLDELMSQARSYPCRRVVITGGEPLESSLFFPLVSTCLLYTSDAADERSSVDLGGRRIIKKKIKILR